MTQTIAKGDFGVTLTAAAAGLTIGYRLENHDGTELAAFTTTNVVELDVANSYKLDADLVLPDAGAVAYWGTASVDLWPVSIGPNPLAALTTAVAALPSLAQINAEVDTALTDYDAPTKGELDAAQASIESDIAALDTVVDAIPAAVAAALAGTHSVTVVSTVSAGAVTVYRGDTWSFAITVSGVTLTDYETLALVAKASESDADTAAILYIRSGANGLVCIGGAEPDSTSAGTLTYTATTATVLISKAETAGVLPTKNATWFLVGLDTTPTPNQKLHRVTGAFYVLDYWMQAAA